MKHNLVNAADSLFITLEGLFNTTIDNSTYTAILMHRTDGYDLINTAYNMNDYGNAIEFDSSSYEDDFDTQYKATTTQ